MKPKRHPSTFSLLWRNLLFTILQPGIVVGLLPYLILTKSEKSGQAADSLLHLICGTTLMVLGLLLFLSCLLHFIREGKGTLSPADPTQILMLSGVYRYSRNPMYIAVLVILFGECLYFQSIDLALYTMLVALLFHLFVVYVEEKRLRKDFGSAYESYCKKVRRWL